jgi:predicted nucleic acid-binding protein
VAERFVLDTSAIFTLTDQEDGSTEVEALLDRATAGDFDVAVCSISLMELYYVALQEQGEEAAARLVAWVKAWPVTWVPPDERDLLLGGRFKAFHRLSFADALIAAVACSRGATLVHKDPEFEALASQLALLALPYRPGSL